MNEKTAYFMGFDPYRDEVTGETVIGKLIPVDGKIVAEYKGRPQLSLEDIEERLRDYIEPFIKNYKWTAEDGTKCSSWTFNTGKNSVHTGDAGAEMIFKEIQKLGFKIPTNEKEGI